MIKQLDKISKIDIIEFEFKNDNEDFSIFKPYSRKNKKWELLNCDTNFYNKVNFKISGFDKDIEIGHLKGYIYNIKKANQEKFDLMDLFDSVSNNSMNLYEAIWNDDHNKYINKLYPDIFFLTEIFIEEECRNKKFGSIILDVLPELLQKNFNYIPGGYFVKPFPIKKDNEGKIIDDIEKEVEKKKNDVKFLERIPNQENLKRLIKFYEKNGYKKILESDFMYLKTGEHKYNLVTRQTDIFF